MEHRIICLIFAIFLCSLKHGTVDAQTTTPSSTDIRLPPSITLSPTSVVFSANQQVLQQCGAVGTPTPTYSWTKNNEALTGSNYVNQGQGTILIQTATAADQGYYQCYATNQWGVAVTNVSYVQLATLGTFPPNSQTVTFAVAQGLPLAMPCNAPTSTPNATYSWATTPFTSSSNQTSVALSTRVIVDPSGNLRFANVIPTDATTGSTAYKCNVYNSYLDNTVGGSYSAISITPANPNNIAPSIAFQTSSPAIALVGQTISLFCFFYGYPTPTITWTASSGLPTGRFTITNYNTTLTITNIALSDQTSYICQGTSSAGTYPASISLSVFVAPQFVSIIDQPTNINATNGQTVNFVCNANANPTPQIVWYRNSKSFSSSSLPNSQYSLSTDLTILTITDVCKECPDQDSSLAVIQCNTTNQYGNVFAEGYLNVLDATTITTALTNQSLTTSQPITFICLASSDPSTPVSYTWLFNGQGITYGNIYSQSGGNLIIDAANAPSGGTGLEGTYTCEASNGFSIANSTAQLLGPTAGPVIVQSAASLWWVFVLIALLLILLLLILCWWCHRHNEGDSYPVDKQERKNGNDPVQEVKQNEFQDFQRPENMATTAQPAQLQSANPRGSWTSAKFESNDDISGNGFSNFDGGKYNDEGSFIGQYVPKKLKVTGTGGAPRLAYPEEDEEYTSAVYPYAVGQDGGYSTMNGDIDENGNGMTTKQYESTHTLDRPAIGQYPYKPTDQNDGPIESNYVLGAPPRMLNASRGSQGEVSEDRPVFTVDAGQYNGNQAMTVQYNPDVVQYNPRRSQSPGGRSGNQQPVVIVTVNAADGNPAPEAPMKRTGRGHRSPASYEANEALGYVPAALFVAGAMRENASANVSYDNEAHFADGIASNISMPSFYVGENSQRGSGYQQDGDMGNGIGYYAGLNHQEQHNEAQYDIGGESAV